MVEGVLKSSGQGKEVIKFESDISIYNQFHERKRPRDKECLILGRDLQSDKQVVVLMDRDTKLLNLRRKITRVGINANNDKHLYSLWEQLKSAVKLIGRMVTGIFWVTPIATQSLMAYEGDTVTVLGVLRFGTDYNSCEVENPLALFLGGRGDLMTYFWQEVTRKDGECF